LEIRSTFLFDENYVLYIEPTGLVFIIIDFLIYINE